MKVRFRLAVALAFLLCGCLVGGAFAATKRITPHAHGGKQKIYIGSKSFTYHKASKQMPLVFRLKGPTPLRVLSRHLYDPMAKPQKVTYRFNVEIDGVVLRTAEETAVVSKQALRVGEGPVGTLEKAVFQVPAGEHTVKIYPSDQGETVAFRVYMGTAKKSATTWIPFSPETYVQAVRVHSGERESTCYRFSQTAPVAFTVEGPLRIKIGTRLDFGAENGTSQTYGIRVALDGKPWKSFGMKSKASHTVVYPDMTEVTPGLERTVALSIPAGRHKVEIYLDRAAVPTASLRILAAQKDLRTGRGTGGRTPRR